MKFFKKKSPIDLYEIKGNLDGHIFSMGRIGSGKCLIKGTKILMKDGSVKNVEDITIGDKVLTPNKKGWAVVKELSSYFSLENYSLDKLKIKENLYSCSGNHLVTVFDMIDKKVLNISAKELYELQKIETKLRNGQYYILQGKVIKTFGNKNCEIDPYLLGVYLGNGRFSSYKRDTKYSTDSMHLEISSMDKNVIGYLANYENCRIEAKKGTECKNIVFSTKGKLSNLLKKYNLFNKKSGDNFIPKEALTSDYNYRLKLLAGLIDTDGCLDISGNIDYISKSRKLVEDILFLIKSLGGNGNIKESWKSCQSFKKKRLYHRISINMNENYYKLPLISDKRKRLLLRKLNKNQLSNKIPFVMKKIKPQQVYGFVLDSKDKLFFIDNFSITHNSVSTKSVIEGFHDNFGYKIFDCYGGERHEGVYWALPSGETDYWNRLGMLGVFDEPGPKQYKVNLLYPYFESKLPSKLPYKAGIVNSKLFTIPLKEVDIVDIMMVIGVASESSKYSWQELKQASTKKTNPSTLLEIADRIKGLKNTPFYKNFIVPMSREKFIMDSYCDLNIDLVEEMRDKETVSVLCLDFVPEQFHLFVMNYLMRQIALLIDANKVGRRNIIFIREAATFFRATDDSVVEDRFKIFRTELSHFIRMGRRGMFFCLDVQSASEVRGIVSGSEDFLLMFKTTSWRDKVEMSDELRRERRMTSMQIADLGFLDRGQCYLAETSRNVRKVQMVLPRSMFWKKEHGNFYKNLWEKQGGDWHFTSEQQDYMFEKCRKATTKEVLAKMLKEKPESAVFSDTDNSNFRQDFSNDTSGENQGNMPNIAKIGGKMTDAELVGERKAIDIMLLPSGITPSLLEEAEIQNNQLLKKKEKKPKVKVDIDKLLNELESVL